MTRIDRVLVAALVVGVWVLVAVTLTSSPVQAEGQEMNRRAVTEVVKTNSPNTDFIATTITASPISCARRILPSVSAPFCQFSGVRETTIAPPPR